MLYKKLVTLLLFTLLGINLHAEVDREDWLKRGRQSISLQNFDLAIFYFSNEIKDNPKNALAYMDRAGAYRRIGEIVKAAEDKKKAYELDPDLIKRIYIPEVTQSGGSRRKQSSSLD